MSARETNLIEQRRLDARLVVLVLSATSAQAAAEAVPSAPDAAAQLWQACSPWLRTPGVRGLAVGSRERRGRVTSTPVVKVLVERKFTSEEMMEPDIAVEPIPAKLPVPGSRRRIEVDIEVVGVGDVDDPYRTRYRPAPAGSVIRRARDHPGTFACVLRDDDSGQRFLLSNAHVIAWRGASQGVVYQPRLVRPARRTAVARLAYAVPVETSELGYPNSVDAAIAEIPVDQRISPKVLGLGSIRGAGALPKKGDRVRSYGPATGPSSAEVVSNDTMIDVNWDARGGFVGRAGFAHIVRCGRYAAPGDSGAAVLNGRDQIVGIHFASTSFASYFVPIQNVLDQLHAHFELTLTVETDAG